MAGDAVFLEAGDTVVFLEAGNAVVFLEAGGAVVFLEASLAFLEVVFTSTDALALPEPWGWPRPLLGRGRGGISDLDGGGVQDLDEPPAFGTGVLGIERTDEK